MIQLKTPKDGTKYLFTIHTASAMTVPICPDRKSRNSSDSIPFRPIFKFRHLPIQNKILQRGRQVEGKSAGLLPT